MAKEAPLAPNPVIMASMGHAGVGIGAEAFRWLLLDVGADPKAPSLRGEKEQLEVLRRYGSTLLRFGASMRRGEVPLVPRALLVDLDPRSANLILQSYPELFAMRDKHALYGLGGAARNWAEGRRRFLEEIEKKQDVLTKIRSVSPEPVRGVVIPFSMGGGTGASFSSEFMRFTKTSGDLGYSTIASFGILPEFGWDPVIFGPSHISITMSLAHQMKYSDCPVLLDNKSMRTHAQRLADLFNSRSSIVDDLPRQLQVGWNEYRSVNLVSAHVIAEFMSSFIRETEWDMSNYRTWLAASKPRFVIPWLMPIVPHGDSSFESIQKQISDGNEGVLFDLEDDGGKPEVGPRDSACVLVKAKGTLEAETRNFFKKIVQDRFEIEDKRIIFIKIPALQNEPASCMVLLNLHALGKRLLPFVKEAEDVWDSYKDEYSRKGLGQEEFKQAVLDVTGHLS
ncbi:MAG: cell division protein FtsZ [Nitrososphaerota archaeon]|nr:cell division protein FtsZ [Nitrososphaerota archaeon]MDG6923658.1 cell division protein FtsZ [Nitrososphaerota archaeon]